LGSYISEKVAQKGCKISILRDIGSWAGHNPALNMGLNWKTEIPFNHMYSVPVLSENSVMYCKIIICSHLQERNPGSTSFWFWQFTLREKKFTLLSNKHVRKICI